MHFQRDRNSGKRASYGQSVAGTSSARSIFSRFGNGGRFQQYIINTSALLLSAERVEGPG